MRTIQGRLKALFFTLCVFCGLLMADWANAQPAISEAQVTKSPIPVWVHAEKTTSAPMANLPPSMDTLSAIVERWDTEIRVADKSVERFEHRITHIQQPAALVDAGTLRVNFVPDYQKVKLHVVRILRGSESIDLLPDLSVRVAQIENGLDRLQLTGRSAAIAQISGLRVGDRIEISYTILGSNPVFGRDISESVLWNLPQFLLQRKVRVLYPNDVELYYQLLGVLSGVQPQIQEQTTSEGRELVLSQTRLLPAFFDPHMPPGLDPFTTLQLSSYDSWAKVQKWAAELFSLNRPSASISRLATELKHRTSNEHQAVERAARFVQDEVRYFSVALSENTHRPHSPEFTLEQRFGDCKDKAMLLVSLLQAMGVRASPVLVSDAKGIRILQYKPTPLAFDHVVVKIDYANGESAYVDATRNANGVPLAKLSDRLKQSAGLVVYKTAGRDAQLEALGQPVPLLQIEVHERVKILGLEQGAQFELNTVLHDRMAELARSIDGQRTAANRDQQFIDGFAQRQPQSKTNSGFPRVTDRKNENLYELAESYSSEHFLSKDANSNIWYGHFGAGQLMGALVDAVPDRNRWLPLGLKLPFTIQKYSVEAEFPDGIVGHDDPLEDHLDTPYFQLRTQRSFRGNRFAFSAEIKVLAPEVPANAMPEFVKSLEDLRKKLLDVVIITEKDIVDTTAPRIPFKEKILANTRQAADTATKVITANRIPDADMASVFLDRALALIQLGEISNATQDINQAIRRAPNLPLAYELRTMVNLRLKKFASAEADITRSMNLGAEAGGIYLRRGQVRYMAGNYADALQDFLQAEKSTETGFNVGFIRIWQSLTRLRLGQPIGNFPAEANTWPQPLLELMHNRTQVEAVVRKAQQSKSEDERESNLCEAYFYIAQWYITNNDNVRAEQFFRKAVETGVLHYTEYELALLALDGKR